MEREKELVQSLKNQYCTTDDFWLHFQNWINAGCPTRIAKIEQQEIVQPTLFEDTGNDVNDTPIKKSSQWDEYEPHKVFSAMLNKINRNHSYREIAAAIGDINGSCINDWANEETIPRGSKKIDRIATVFSSVYKKELKASKEEVLSAINDAIAYTKAKRRRVKNSYEIGFARKDTSQLEWSDFGKALSDACNAEGIQRVGEFLEYLHSYDNSIFEHRSNLFRYTLKSQYTMNEETARTVAGAIRKVLSAEVDWESLLMKGGCT